MSAISNLKNDRSTIIAVVCEHYLLNKKEIPKIKISKLEQYKHASHKIITHGEWIFCYHRDTGVVYIE